MKAIVDRVMNAINSLWSLLPDRCEVQGCCRKGVRGNENIVNGMIACDDCHTKSLQGHELKLRRRP